MKAFSKEKGFNTLFLAIMLILTFGLLMAMDYQTALKQWWEIYNIAEDERTKKIASNHIYQTKAAIDIHAIGLAIKKFKEKYSRNPVDLSQFLMRKKEGVGMGDVTMMLMIGAYLGWQQAFFTLILASLAGALVGAFFIFFKKKSPQYALPFGTFLSPAAFFALLWGEKVLTAYLSLYKNLLP